MKSLKGMTTAVMTPLDARGNFDPAGFDRLMDYLIEGGIDNYFVLGVAGEFAALSMDIKKQVVDAAHKKLAGKYPLIVGVTADSTNLAIENVKTYAAGKADFILSTPTNFLPLSQNALHDYFTALANQSPVPLVIYNCPLNKNYVEAATMTRLADHPNIAGVKETSTMMKLIEMQLAVGNRNDFTILSGWEDLFVPALSIGIDAFTMGGPGNLLPKYCKDVYVQYRKGEHQKTAEQFLAVTRFLHEIFSISPGALSAMKATLSILGLTQKYMAAPTETATDDHVTFIRQTMIKSGLYQNLI